MKKLINTALVYLIAGAAAGVFFREFTNFAQFTGQTTLGLMHPHLLVLGFAVFRQCGIPVQEKRIYRSILQK